MKQFKEFSRTGIFRFFFVLFTTILLIACSEKQIVIEKKLEHTLQDDLRWIVAEVVRGSGKEGVLEEPYYVLEDLKYFEGDTARVFAAYARVKFHYFKDLNMVQERKYRYNTQRKFWDRYYKKLLHEAPKD